jgi:hypothetical protein
MMPKKKTETQQNTYMGVTVDVSDISGELTDRARRFVFWFCFPGSDAFQNKKRAAIAAGYAPRNASISGYKLCKNPQVVKEIDRVSKSHKTETIDTLHRKYINSLETRAFYDLKDYISGASFKPIEEIAPEKQVCLEQAVVDREGKIVAYAFGSRRAAMAEIREVYAKEHPGGDDNAFDPDETFRILAEVGKNKVLIEHRRRNEQLSRDAAYIRRPPVTAREEL